MSNVSWPEQGVGQGVLEEQLGTFLGGLLVGGEIADGLAGGGAAYGQQKEYAARSVLEFAPQTVGRLALHGREVDDRPAHEVVLVAFVAVPYRDLQLLADVWILVKVQVELFEPHRA